MFYYYDIGCIVACLSYKRVNYKHILQAKEEKIGRKQQIILLITYYFLFNFSLQFSDQVSKIITVATKFNMLCKCCLYPRHCVEQETFCCLIIYYWSIFRYSMCYFTHHMHIHLRYLISFFPLHILTWCICLQHVKLVIAASRYRYFTIPHM